MSRASSPALLVLHAVRVRGATDSAGAARRYGLDPGATHDSLVALRARGHVVRTTFAGSDAWSLTGAGRAEDERLLAAELDAAPGARDAVAAVHDAFLPLNGTLRAACTAWQLRPTADDPLAENDHADPAWDAAVVDALVAVDRGLRPLARRLTDTLDRFAGYDARFGAALAAVLRGDETQVAGTGVDSCHTVWMELHEDLIATLGVPRGA